MQYLRQCYPRVDRTGVRGEGGREGGQKRIRSMSRTNTSSFALFLSLDLYSLASAYRSFAALSEYCVIREIILTLWRIAYICKESLADKNDSVTK